MKAPLRDRICCPKQLLHGFAKRPAGGNEVFNGKSAESDRLSRPDCRTTTYRVAV